MDQQRNVYRIAEQIGQIGIRRRTAYDLVEGIARVRMIGTAINMAGRKWIDTHPRQMAWLKSQAVTPEAAVEEAMRWSEKEFSDPFFQRS